jgi:hypothetical protein
MDASSVKVTFENACKGLVGATKDVGSPIGKLTLAASNKFDDPPAHGCPSSCWVAKSRCPDKAASPSAVGDCVDASWVKGLVGAAKDTGPSIDGAAGCREMQDGAARSWEMGDGAAGCWTALLLKGA